MIEEIKNRYSTTLTSANDEVMIYSDYSEEVNSVKYGVGIYHRINSAILKLFGNDVLDFLQRITTNDVLNLETNHHVTTLLTNEKGRLIDRTSLIKVEENYYLAGGKNNAPILERWLEKYIITEDVKIENLSSKFSILDIIGPQAESYLTLLCGETVDDLDNNVLHKVEINDIEVFLLKKSTYEESIYWLIVDDEKSGDLLKYMLDNKSVFDLSMIGENAFNYYRVQKKLAALPNEINDSYNPHEAGLIKYISFNKGCYIGQEIITRLKTYEKVQRNLCKIIIEDSISSNYPITLFNKNGEEAITITTGAEAVENNHLETLGFVRTKFEIKKNISLSFYDEDKNEVKIRVIS